MRVLKTTPKIFEELGGISAVAELTDSAYTAAHNWKAWNKFPPRTYVLILAALKRRGATAPPSLWGMMEATE